MFILVKRSSGEVVELSVGKARVLLAGFGYLSVQSLWIIVRHWKLWILALRMFALRLIRRYPDKKKFCALLSGVLPELQDCRQIGFRFDDDVVWFSTVRMSILSIIALARQVQDIIESDQYQLRSVRIDDGIVIDAGANIGVFSIFAARLGAQIVYAYEPVSVTREILMENIRLNHLENRIHVSNQCLGKAIDRQIICYNRVGDLGARVNGPGKFSETVECVPVDVAFSDRTFSVKFIKIDAEGAEKDILSGAAQIINSDNPVLSFSAYHHMNDVVELPDLVRTLASDYSCTLRDVGEPVLVCRKQTV